MMRRHSQSPQKRIAIVGAGIIGLSCALELAERGALVSIYDKSVPGRGASWAAAGMLAPAFEVGHERGAHPDLFDLCLKSSAIWPEFAAGLQRRCGHEVGFRSGPSLAVAASEDDLNQLERIAVALSAKDVEFESLSAGQLSNLDSGLSSHLLGGLKLPTDGHVDNRLVVLGLIRACEATDRISLTTNAPIDDLNALLSEHDDVLCAAGWQSAGLLDDAASVMPIGGQLLSVRKQAGIPDTTVRCGSIYIAPKTDRIVIGASSEPGVVRGEATEEAIETLKRAAADIYPGLAGAEILEAWAGVRPGTPDQAPLLGRVSGQPIYFATGHTRNGILLAPVTAEIMADMILDGQTSALARAFSPGRFVPSEV